MNFTIEIIKPFAPVIVILLAVAPFLFIWAFHKKNEKPKLANYHWLIIYLIVLGFIACLLIVLPGIQLMAADNSDRSLFICSILLVACIDQALNLMPIRIRLQFDLAGLLLYSIVILSTVPLLWQLSTHVVSPDISGRQGVMRVAEITLMLIMVVLCVSAGFMKKVKPKQIE